MIFGEIGFGDICNNTMDTQEIETSTCVHATSVFYCPGYQEHGYGINVTSSMAISLLKALVRLKACKTIWKKKGKLKKQVLFFEMYVFQSRNVHSILYVFLLS